MIPTSINLLAVLAAALAAFAFGAVYYTALSKPWMEAAGLTEDQVRQGGSAGPFATSFAGLLVHAAVLSWILGRLPPDAATMGGAVGTAAALWLGLVATTSATNNAFRRVTAKLTVIDALHWLGVAVIQALVVGAFASR